MIIIIDAYNVLKQTKKYEEISHSQREYFIALLSNYAKIKKHRLIIVFDGGPSNWPSKSRRDYVEVVYSGQQKSADDYIKEFLEDNIKKELLVVSSDRELVAWAQEHDVVSIDSHLFYSLIQNKKEEIAKKDTGHIVKIASSSDETVDNIMKEAASSIEYKKEDTLVKDLYAQKSEKVKKQDKRMLHILKKL